MNGQPHDFPQVQPSVVKDRRGAERLRSYFSKPGYQRVLSAVWDRYAGLGKSGGHAVIPQATAEECEAVNDFMGWNVREGTTIRLSLSALEKELLQSVFACTLPELYQALTGAPLLTKLDRTLLAGQEWQALFGRMENELKVSPGMEMMQEPVRAWLNELKSGTREGYRTLRDLWRQSPERAEEELRRAVRAWSMLLAPDLISNGNLARDKPIRLPVLAALATGDSHALDRSNPAGRLFYQALRSSVAGGKGDGLSREEKAQEAEWGVDSLEVRRYYRAAGVLDDDISSIIHLYDPLNRDSPGPCVMTLRQVEVFRHWACVTDIYAVENPAVFSTLVDATEGWGQVDCTESGTNGGPLLLCTSGPASAAALQLLDRYAQEGKWSGKLIYSGDFDVKGLEMANVLAGRYASRYAPWRYDASTYRQFVGRHAGPAFLEEELRKLKNKTYPWCASMCEEIRLTGVKLYQEAILPVLVDDWLKACRVAVR